MKLDSKSGILLAALVGLSCLLVLSQMQRGNRVADTARLEACVSQHSFRISTARGMGEKPDAWDERELARCTEALESARAGAAVSGPLQGMTK